MDTTLVSVQCSVNQTQIIHIVIFLHGYSLAFKFTFGCSDLDNKNWAVDFGGLKPLKQWLEDTFDHKTVIDSEDPHMEDFVS
jgi:6-pyruvoyltetrahydropterin/6-carboxytetrahydropterin synthase